MNKIIVTTQEELRQIIIESLSAILQKPELPITPKPDILNIEQVAELLDLSISSVYTKVNKRLIPHFKRGKRLYFRLIEISDWIQNGRRLSIEEAINTK